MKLSLISFRLALLLSALFFGGCIKDDRPVFEVPPDLRQADTRLVDSFSTYLETFRFDSLQSSGREFLFVGKYPSGAVLGGFRTEGYFQFLPESYPQVCPEPDSILDEYTKATLSLYLDETYGTTGTDQYALYPLTTVMRGDKSYYTFEPPPGIANEPQFTTIGASRTEKFIKIDANQLGRDIISRWKQWRSFTDDQQFLTAWKGFAIRSLGVAEQISRFDLDYADQTPSTFLEISYRVKKGANDPPEEKKLRFRTNTSTLHFYRVIPEFGGSAFEGLGFGQGLPITQTSGKTAIQGLSGLATRVHLPGVLSWKNSLNQKVKVFKAELEITPDDPGSQAPPTLLQINCRQDYARHQDADKSTVVFNEEAIFSLLAQGFLSREAAKNQATARVFSYNSTSNVYRCNITGHIQAILDGERTSPFLNISSAQWATTANRLLMSSGSVKLKIYYYPI